MRGENLAPACLTGDAGQAERFYASALSSGHEGIMVKAPDSPYESGRRGGSWLKVKDPHTVDLVVLAAEWGSGRRQGVEIASNDLQRSARYPGGLALRFARVKRYRPDKTAEEADTLDTLRRIFEAQGGR